MASSPFYIAPPHMHAMHLAAPPLSGYRGGAAYCPPPPGLEPPAHLGMNAAGRGFASASVPDLFFGARLDHASGEPVKVVRGIGGGLILQHHAREKKAETEDVDSHSTCTPPPECPWSSPEDQPAPQKGKKTRFCKAKRDRYRKLVERLVEELRRNPLTFNLESADLPASITLNPESKEKLWATVLKFANV